MPSELYIGLQQQIYVLGGHDGIVAEIRDFMAKTNKRHKIDVACTAHYIERCGAVDYALFIIKKTSTSISNSEMVQDELVELLNALLDKKHNVVAKNRTLCMALHQKSTSAAIKVLGPDLLRMCVQWVKTERVVLWEEVLAEWLWVRLVDKKKTRSRRTMV